MNYYCHICVTCAIEIGKRWILPGSEISGKPRHDTAELDELHPAIPVSLHSEQAQLAMLARAMVIIRLAAPAAVIVELETSDQDRYGFILRGIRDADGGDLLPAWWDDFSHPLSELGDQVCDEISDLDWDGVVGENSGGYATINLRDFFAGVSHPAVKLPLGGSHPEIEGGR
jgi:hypothetical protein